MTTANFDLGYLETAVELLQNYLLSKDLYWKMNAGSPPGEPGYPSLTLGAVLLSQARLAARSLPPSEKSRKVNLQNQLEGIRLKWRSAWGGKAREEFRYRLNLWRNFLEEFREDPQGNFDRYSYEVSRRVILDLLSKEADYIPREQEQLLKGLDRILEGLMLPGNFVWDQALVGGFPSEEYPYLYSRLRK
jgi:hypothetical protein